MKLKRPNRWGTKSISEQRTDLGIVRSSGVGDSVEIMLPTAQQDIDMAYDEALMALKTASIFLITPPGCRLTQNSAAQNNTEA